MKFDSFVKLIGPEPFFDLATAVQLSGEDRAGLRTQLYRWVKADKLIPLRRGMYTLADRYRRGRLNPAKLANHLYRPSYLSGLWALGFYGLIPEKVVAYTSISTRVPRRFENPFGLFEYRHIKQDAFFGYRVVEILQDDVMLAEPEKALLDFWHLEPGHWTVERMSSMRFQGWDSVDATKLTDFARKFKSPRLARAVTVWTELATNEQGGTVGL